MGGDEPFVRVRGRHADVEDSRIRPVNKHRCQRLGSVARLGDDLAADIAEDADDAGSREKGIVGTITRMGERVPALAVSSARPTGRAEAVKDVLGDLADTVREHPYGVSFPGSIETCEPGADPTSAVTIA